MKVILLQDVAKIGRRFQIVEVPDGFAQNKLIPKRLAEPTTPANVKRVEARADKNAASQAGAQAAFKAAAAALKEVVVNVTAESNPEGKLFQALKPTLIIAAIQKETGVALEERWVGVPTPIKTVGEHIVLLSLGDAQGEFTINVVSK